MHGIQVLSAAYLALNQRGDGSSPSSPTGCFKQDVGKPGNPPVLGTGNRGFNSHHPDWFLRCGRVVRRLPVKEKIAGSIPAAAVVTEGQANWRWQPSRKRLSDKP